jgi:CheY-like chemotaxis protein
VTDAALVESLGLPRLLLAGEAGSRPDGLERALTRAGFRVCEGTCVDPAAPPDAILLTVGPAKRVTLADRLRGGENGPPRVVLLAGGDADLPGAALELGADDAVSAPVHLPELCARIHARIRDRQAPRRTGYAREAREALETSWREDDAAGRDRARPRTSLARAFDLAACASWRPDRASGARRGGSRESPGRTSSISAAIPRSSRRCAPGGPSR